MVSVHMRSSLPLDKNSINDINFLTSNVKSKQNILSINNLKNNKQSYSNPSTATQRVNSEFITSTATRSMPTAAFTSTSTSADRPVSNQTTPSIKTMCVPKLTKQIKKGQKVLLDPSNLIKHINVCLGWNVKNPKCDIDVSAFILGSNGQVLGDDWFVFYGQEYSPDKSVRFCVSNSVDREFIAIDLNKLNSNAEKIVFVLTINEATENNLNFSMVKDAYIRILNADNDEELVSFEMTDYYSNVISMMIGEVYLHKGNWKCNAIGNGVAKDLAGLCKLYGVKVED